MAESFVHVLIHYNGEIINTIEGETFCSDNQAWLVVHPPISFLQLQCRILEEYEGNNVQVSKIFYRMPVDIGPNGIRYRKWRIRKDEHIAHMFSYFNSFAEARTIELFVELQGGHFSSASSAPDPSIADVSPSFEVSHHDVHQDEVASPSLEHFARQIEEPLPLNPQPLSEVSPIGEFDFIVQHQDDENDEEEDPDNAGSYEEEEQQLFHMQNCGEHLMSRSQSQSQQLPSHYSTVDLDAMRSDGSGGSGSGSSIGGETELALGQVFRNKDEVLFAVKHYSIRRGVQYKVYESDHIKFHCRCVRFGIDCQWSIRVTLRRKLQMWEVRKLTGPHTCVFPESMNQHAQMDYHIICAHIYPLVQADPTIAIKSLQASVESELRFKTTYRKVWLAKQKAIAMIYGDWEESYNELPRWLGGLMSYMPGTIVQMQTGPYYVGDVIDQGCIMFHRLFWTYPPCIEAFKYCKRLISIDGTHLYGKYAGTLLMAIAQDGNSNILPVAFAVVEGETKEGWSFFLRNLRQHVTPQDGILVISDRHQAIKSALEAEGSGWHPPSAYHAYCARHIASNFAVKFKNKDAKRLLMNAAYAKTEHNFLYWFRALEHVKPEMCAWASNIPREKWAHYADEGRRFGHMTTNLSECMNAVMKGTRNLPITAIVKSTYYRLIELFVRKGTEAKTQLASGRKFSETLLNAIQENRRHLGIMSTTQVTRDDLYYLVFERDDIGSRGRREFRVHLTERWCDCGEFQKLHYPCRHALAACSDARRDWSSFVHEVYTMESVFNVYKAEFSAVANEEMWPPYTGLPIRPNPALKRTLEGRPVSTRIHNEMDEPDPSQGKHCGLCRGPGHTRRTCPYAPSSSQRN